MTVDNAKERGRKWTNQTPMAADGRAAAVAYRGEEAGCILYLQAFRGAREEEPFPAGMLNLPPVLRGLSL